MLLKRSLRSRRLEVVGARKNGRESVSPSRAPVLSCAHYFQQNRELETKLLHDRARACSPLPVPRFSNIPTAFCFNSTD